MRSIKRVEPRKSSQSPNRYRRQLVIIVQIKIGQIVALLCNEGNKTHSSCHFGTALADK
jgi:hypothetical protein